MSILIGFLELVYDLCLLLGGLIGGLKRQSDDREESDEERPGWMERQPPPQDRPMWMTPKQTSGTHSDGQS